MRVRHGENFSILISSICTTYSIEHFNDILDTILLIISLLNLSIVLATKFYRYMKDGQIDEEEAKDLKQDLEEGKKIVETIKKKEGE